MISDKPLAESVASVLGRAPVVTAESSCADIMVTPGEALERARRLLPSHEMATLNVPSQPGGAYEISLRRRGSTMPVRGDAAAVVSACGNVISLRRPADNGRGDALLGHVVDIHNGRIAGWPGQSLVFTAGLSLSLLPLLSIAAWAWRKARHPRPVGAKSPRRPA